MEQGQYTEQDLVDFYGPESLVKSGEITMSLQDFLEAEQLFCPASDESRQDPVRRAQMIASVLRSGGSLIEPHVTAFDTESGA